MTITGTNFAAGAMVTFGGAAATNVAVSEQHDDHGNDSRRKCGCGDGDRHGERAKRESNEWIYLCSCANGEQCESE